MVHYRRYPGRKRAQAHTSQWTLLLDVFNLHVWARCSYAQPKTSWSYQLSVLQNRRLVFIKTIIARVINILPLLWIVLLLPLGSKYHIFARRSLRMWFRVDAFMAIPLQGYVVIDSGWSLSSLLRYGLPYVFSKGVESEAFALGLRPKGGVQSKLIPLPIPLSRSILNLYTSFIFTGSFISFSIAAVGGVPNYL